jgi:hypothetical protein
MHYEESYKSFNGEYLYDDVVSLLGLICALAAKGKHFIPFVNSETCAIRDLVSQMSAGRCNNTM